MYCNFKNSKQFISGASSYNQAKMIKKKKKRIAILRAIM